MNFRLGFWKLNLKAFFTHFSLLVITLTSQVCFSAAQTANTDEVYPVPGGLTLKGAAPVPMSLVKATEKYNDYYQAPSVEGWTADGKIIIKEFGKTPTLSTYSQAKGKPASLLVFPHPAYNIYPSPDRRNYLYNQDTDGKLNYRMFVWNQEKAESSTLTETGTRAVQPIWSPSGKYIAYSFSAPETKGMEIAWQNPFEPAEKRTVFSSPYMVQAVDWSPDDRYIAVEEYVNLADMSRLWFVEPQTGNKILLNASEKDTFGINEVQFSRDGKSIYLTSNRAGEFLSFEQIEIAGKQWTTVYRSEKSDIEIAQISPDESKAAFVFNDQGISRLAFFDLKTNKLDPVSKLNPGVITNLKWSPDSKQIAFNLDYTNEVSSIYTVEAASKQITRWVHEPDRETEDENLPIAERIEWQSKPDGKTIGGWLFRSKKSAAASVSVTSAKYPVIIDFHGGPADEARPVLNFSELYYLNELGAVVIYPNVRGSRGSGKSFSLADNGEGRAGQLDDVAGLFGWIEKQSSLDAKRVMVRGFSYGGFLALLSTAKFRDKIAAVSAHAAPTNLITLQTNDTPWRAGTSRTEFGDETNPNIRQTLQRIAVSGLAENLKVPILLAHGELDTQVPVSEPRQLVEALEKQSPAPPPLWTVFSRSDKHGLNGVRGFYHSLLEIVFFETYVLRRGRN